MTPAPINDAGRSPPSKWDAVPLGKVTDAEAARLAGSTKAAARVARVRRGIRLSRNVARWRADLDWPSVDHLLGKVSDCEIGRRLDCAPQVVRNRRLLRDIPAVGPAGRSYSQPKHDPAVVVARRREALRRRKEKPRTLTPEQTRAKSARNKARRANAKERARAKRIADARALMARILIGDEVDDDAPPVVYVAPRCRFCRVRDADCAPGHLEWFTTCGDRGCQARARAERDEEKSGTGARAHR